MILFYQFNEKKFYAVSINKELSLEDKEKLAWLFGNANLVNSKIIEGFFVGPRKEMITPWSTNAVEISKNMGIVGISRIEEFYKQDTNKPEFDPMLKAFYNELNQEIFRIEKTTEPVLYIKDIYEYNKQEGLALSNDEVEYLNSVSKKIKRNLTDSEVFGFSQVNSEHCRHKIFNGTFIIDGEEMPETLFQLIRKTSNKNPNRIVSAYKDNCAFVDGPIIEQFAPESQDKPDYFVVEDIKTVISLKAETHNFPTTVEPFNGAATGSGGEIRDRLAGGKASLPIAGTAVYMTSYSRNDESREWEKATKARKWLYQSPEQILVKASNGASDFGNKFGQPLICGSLLTFEHQENNKKYAYDKVIMLAGGIGFGKEKDSMKETPEKGDVIVVLGGDNYRIGMGGGAVSSVATGEYNNAIELNAVQRSNPEMQKRVANIIRAMAEAKINPIVSIHDHGAGGHLNCLSELVEEIGGKIDLRKLPIGDPTLSSKEIVGNESQERMGLIIKEKDIEKLQKIADRERAPMYVVGKTTGDMRFTFEDKQTGENPIDLDLFDMFGKPPKSILKDKKSDNKFRALEYDINKIHDYIEQVLQLESVACKDWLTNKVDRSVTGKIAHQQNAGSLHLPLNDCGVAAIDYRGKKGIVTSIGHAPISALISPESGSRLSVAEALTNIIWAPIEQSLKGISLSANWMWPAKNESENARLYEAVKGLSDFCIELGINVPTGKDSLSMTQKYGKNDLVYSPGTVIVSTVGELEDVRKVVSPVFVDNADYSIFYIDFSQDNFSLGGSSFAQIINRIGDQAPTIKNAEYFKNAFNAIQYLIKNEKIVAGHDISAGGLVTSLLETSFAENNFGLDINLSNINETDIIKLLFSENPGIIMQSADSNFVEKYLTEQDIQYHIIGNTCKERNLYIKHNGAEYKFEIDTLRDLWYKPSYLLDKKQSGNEKALERFNNYKKQELKFDFKDFSGIASDLNIDINRRQKTGVRAAIIREKGVNGDREMAYALYLAGFDVKDVHMTDLISGRETLQDINMLVFVGGFSNSDVLGSAKGWAGAFIYNTKARKTLDDFYKRSDTLSLGVCNGCQLMQELELIVPEHKLHPKMIHNDSNKFESGFVNVEIPKNNSVMLNTLEGMRLGVWVANGEGKFNFPYSKDDYSIPMKYSYNEYPGNPNGSAFSAAAICSADGRHLAMMPHIERAFAPWQWAHYPNNRKKDEVSPWVSAFVNAKKWIETV